MRKPRRGLAASLLAVVSAVAVAGAAAAVPATSACNTHQCDPSCLWVGVSPDAGFAPGCTLGAAPDQHVFASDNGDVWESGAFGDPWLEYHGQQTYRFVLPPGFRGPICNISPWISTAEDQSTAGAMAVPGTGQLDQFYDVFDNEFTIFNNSCADYFLRVIVQACPPGGAADAGSDR